MNFLLDLFETEETYQAVFSSKETSNAAEPVETESNYLTINEVILIDGAASERTLSQQFRAEVTSTLICTPSDITTPIKDMSKVVVNSKDYQVITQTDVAEQNEVALIYLKRI